MPRHQQRSAPGEPKRSQATGSGWRLVAIAVAVAVGLAACGDGDEVEVGADAGAGSGEDEAGARVVDETAPEVEFTPYADDELIPLCLEDADRIVPADDAPGVLVDRDGFGYCVGPALFVEVESAEVVGPAGLDVQLGPTVQPIFTESGIGAFNQLAALCFQPPGGPTPCPLRQVAIIADDTVVSAPTIQAPEFARDQIVIAGSFTQEEADALADTMAADGLLEVRPVLLLLGPPGADGG